MECTMSLHLAPTSVAEHNNRKGWFVKNEEHIKNDSDYVVYMDEDIRKVYDLLFGESVKRFNARQKNKERVISNYYQRMLRSHKTKSGRKAYYEIVVELGDLFNHPSPEISKVMCEEYLKGFGERNGSFHVCQAVWHNDERAKVWDDGERAYKWVDSIPHMHIRFVPFARSERGLEKQVSMRGALREMGYVSDSSGYWNSGFKKWLLNERRIMADLCREHGVLIVKGDAGNRYHYAPSKYRALQTEMQKLSADVRRTRGNLEKSVSQLSVLDSMKKDLSKKIEKKKTELDALESAETEKRKAAALDSLAERLMKTEPDLWKRIKDFLDKKIIAEYEKTGITKRAPKTNER